MSEEKVIPYILSNIPDYEYNNNKTSILGLIYSNKIQIMLNELETFGSVIYASTDEQNLVCNVEILLGNREDEIMRLYARKLLELFRNKGYDKQDLLLFTSIKKHSLEHLKGILRHIEENVIK